MVRSAENEFGGRPPWPILCAPGDLANLVIDNAASLAEYRMLLAAEWRGQYQFTPDIVLECNRLAIQGIHACAGEYRDRFVMAGSHVPPAWSDVPALVLEMCECVNRIKDDPLHAAAYLLWRVNWIHPFYDGNGRVARELPYLALLAGNNVAEFPGSPTIPELIDGKYRDAYYDALHRADKAWAAELTPDVRALESLISDLVVEQFDSLDQAE